MTFDEFKKEQEAFVGKLTGLKLEQLKDSYRFWQLNKEDQNYLEPILNIQEFFTKDNYYKRIKTSFEPLQLENNELSILVLPSFKPEYQVKFRNHDIIKASCEESIWEDIYQGLGKRINLNVESIDLSIEKKNEFVKLVKENLKQARKPKVNTGVLDGIQYFFIYKEDNKLRMKKRRTYQEEANKLAAAIDIAIEAFTLVCPPNVEKSQQEHFISCYSEWKERCLNPDPRFKNLTSLQYSINDVFTYFQEGTGQTVEYFWKKIDEVKLDYKRENKLEKILKRGKIRGRIEYEYVTDMIVVAEQIGMTNKNETIILGDLLAQYESENKNN